MKTNILILELVAFAIIALCSCSKDSSNEDSPKNGNIKFEDGVAKARLVQKYDLNSDGELSYSEASAVTTLSLYWENIKYLDELQYFTGITKFSFPDYSNCLERFSIPKNVSTLHTYDITKEHYPALKQIKCYSTTIPTYKNFTELLTNYYVHEVNCTHIVYVPKEVLSKCKDVVKETLQKDGYTEDEINGVLNRIKSL